MKVKLPKKLKIYFIPEEDGENYPLTDENAYEVEVQVLSGHKLVMWFTDKSKKRLRRNEHILNPGLVLIAGEDNKEDD